MDESNCSNIFDIGAFYGTVKAMTILKIKPPGRYGFMMIGLPVYRIM